MLPCVASVSAQSPARTIEHRTSDRTDGCNPRQKLEDFCPLVSVTEVWYNVRILIQKVRIFEKRSKFFALSDEGNPRHFCFLLDASRWLLMQH